VAGIVSRLAASLDRIPAPQAFAFAALVGAVEGFILFIEDGLPEIPFLAYSLPIVAFIGLMLLATALVGFSQPVVTRRELGSLGGRVGILLLNFGRLATFQALAAAIFFVPVVVYKTNKWSQPPPDVGRFDDNTIAATPPSSSVAHSATPNPGPLPTAKSTTAVAKAPALAASGSSSSGPTTSSSRDPVERMADELALTRESRAFERDKHDAGSAAGPLEHAMDAGSTVW
jgi:hypothetical protein